MALMSKVDVSVAICTLNRAESLRETLATFTAMAVPASVSWELIVVDNGSTDATQAVIAEFADVLPIRRLVETKRGQSAARNAAIRDYRGEYLLWTDDDVRIDVNWMTATLAAFEKFGADVVFGRSYPIWSAGEPSWYGTAFAGRFALLDYGPEPFVVKNLAQQFYGLNVAFRRSAMTSVGPFREDLGYIGVGIGGGGDDTDVFERALQRGLTVWYAPASVVGHVISSERATTRKQRQMAWSGAKADYRIVSARFKSVPWLAGVPRFYYRVAAGDALAWLRNTLLMKRSEAFYSELRLIGFAGLLCEAYRARRAAPSSPPAAA
jgi:glycosyltransferase involved in cell wall biosynthesis